jgi:predicted AlkP superfamily phosphohydrolase/phosphomutase
MHPEVFGPQNPATLLAQRLEVLETNRQFGDICHDMLRQPFDLFLAVFGAPHRGTHYLWDLSQIDAEGLDRETLALLEGARDECYESWDRELGRLVEAAPADARIVAFALHGMAPNDGWYERLADIVAQIHRGGGAAPGRKGLLYRAKQALPWTLVRQVTRRIPHSWNKALVPLWSRRMLDWSTTRYFTLPMDYNGYIRFNLKGREAEGIVAREEMPGLAAELDRALGSFRDVESGKQVIRGTLLVDDLIEPGAPYRDHLPDLVVLWDPPHSTLDSSGVVSDRYGEVRWPKGERFRSGRSGNHTPHGWIAAAGPGISPGQLSAPCDTVDLMPTIFEWLGAPRPPHFAGRPIDRLLSGSP